VQSCEPRNKKGASRPRLLAHRRPRRTRKQHPARRSPDGEREPSSCFSCSRAVGAQVGRSVRSRYLTLARQFQIVNAILLRRTPRRKPGGRRCGKASA
jgi:hypothetical protein